MPRRDYWRHWVALREFFYERLTSPASHPAFIIYFIIAVLGVGGLGIWTSLGSDTTAINAGLYSYFLALTAASAFDLVLADEHPKSVRATAFAVGVIIIALSIFMITHPMSDIAVGVGVGCSLTAALLWWIANAENPNLRDAPPSTPSTGGDVDQPIPGTVEGYET